MATRRKRIQGAPPHNKEAPVKIAPAEFADPEPVLPGWSQPLPLLEQESQPPLSRPPEPPKTIVPPRPVPVELKCQFPDPQDFARMRREDVVLMAKNTLEQIRDELRREISLNTSLTLFEFDPEDRPEDVIAIVVDALAGWDAYYDGDMIFVPIPQVVTFASPQLRQNTSVVNNL